MKLERYMAGLRNVEPMQLPPMLAKAVPLSQADFSGGQVVALIKTIGLCNGFREKTLPELREIVAEGMGYDCWEDMQNLTGDMPTSKDLPRRSGDLLDVIAWRMFRTGNVGLREARVAIEAGWACAGLALRGAYGDFGQLEHGREEVRRHTLPQEWAAWKETLLLDNGMVRVQFAGELAWGVADLCWTEHCGVSAQDITREIARGAEYEPGDLIEDSWFYSRPWPYGLHPLEYRDQLGGIVGYGWGWAEIGVRSAAIYGSREAFKQSAIALWTLKPAGVFARQDLPETLVEVEFDNPWDPRDLTSMVSDDMKRAVAFERRNKDQTPWMELHKTNGRALTLGRDLEIAGDAWTGRHTPAPAVGGLLGLVLPCMAEVVARDSGVEWILDKVPFAMGQADYEMLCRLALAWDDLKVAESQWLMTEPAAGELSALLAASAAHAGAGISARSARVMEEPTGLVAGWDVPHAGAAVHQIYPELKALKPENKGEYALAFYGKDAIRDGSHRRRDPAFKAYAILRNVGVDVQPTYRHEHLVLCRLLRTWGKVVWGSKESVQGACEAARKVLAAHAWAEDLFDGLDASLGPSRLVALGIRQERVEHGGAEQWIDV